MMRVNIYLDLVPRFGVRAAAHLQVKVKLTLEQVTKSQRGGVELQLYTFFNFGARCVSCQDHAPAVLRSWKDTVTLYRRLGGRQGRSGRVRKISLSQRFDTRTVQPVTSRYTVCAIPGHTVHLLVINFFMACTGIDFSITYTASHMGEAVLYKLPYLQPLEALRGRTLLQCNVICNCKICLERETEEVHERLADQDCQCSGRDLKTGPQKNEATALFSLLRRY